MEWALFWMLNGPVQALGGALGAFLIHICVNHFIGEGNQRVVSAFRIYNLKTIDCRKGSLNGFASLYNYVPRNRYCVTGSFFLML